MRLALLFCLIILCSSCGKNGDKILLRLKYSKGDVYKFRFQRYNSVNENNEILANEVISMRYKVDSILGDSVYALSAKIEEAKFKIPGERFSSDDRYYSSSEDEVAMTAEQKEIAKIFNYVKNLSLSLDVSKRGRVTKPYTLANNVAIPQLFSPIDYKICQIVFPEEPISIGEEWKNEDVISGSNAKKITYYKIELIEKSVIKINVEGTVQLADKKTEFSGKYYLDEKTSKLISAKLFFKNNFFLKGKGLINIDISADDLISFATN